MIDLDREALRLEPSSVVDQVGKVFHYRERVFRAISPGYADFVHESLDLASARGWYEQGLVRSWATDYRLDGYPLVIEHERVPFVTLRGEWTGEGLREAALCLLRLNLTLVRDGYCLKDAHPWNLLFEGPRPCFVDWGSLRPLAEFDWGFWYGQFRQFVLAPLYAFASGRPRIARAMLREHFYGVGNELVALPEFAACPEALHAIAAPDAALPLVDRLEALLGYVAGLALETLRGEWADYAQPAFDALTDLSSLREKDRLVYQLLKDDPGQTLLDIGTNRGLHAEMAAALGKRVIACDIEESCLNALFQRVRRSGADILPLYHDVLWPLGTSGLFNGIPGAEQRLRCDTVLVMAVTHHLAFKQHVSFEAMARGIAALTRRRAIVEFVPAEDEHVALWSPERLPWYRLDHFIQAMLGHFHDYRILPSAPAPRVVVVLDRLKRMN